MHDLDIGFDVTMRQARGHYDRQCHPWD